MRVFSFALFIAPGRSWATFRRSSTPETGETGKFTSGFAWACKAQDAQIENRRRSRIGAGVKPELAPIDHEVSLRRRSPVSQRVGAYKKLRPAEKPRCAPHCLQFESDYRIIVGGERDSPPKPFRAIALIKREPKREM